MFDFEATEKKIIRLFALIHAIKASAENLDEGIADEHKFSIIGLAEIADALTDAVYQDVSEIETEGKPKPLYKLITSVLTHPETPNELYKTIEEGLSVLSNKSDNKALDGFLASPEYIAQVLEGAKNNE